MKVLVCEKVPSVQSALRLVLSQFREISHIAEVESAGSLKEKIAGEWPDILLIDHDFLGIETRDAIIALKAEYRDMSIVVLGKDAGLKDRHLKTCIDEYIVKGYPPDRLYNTLKHLIKKHRSS